MTVSFWAGHQYQIVNLDLVRRIYTIDAMSTEFPYKIVLVFDEKDEQKIGFKEESLRNKYVDRFETLLHTISMDEPTEEAA